LFHVFFIVCPWFLHVFPTQKLWDFGFPNVPWDQVSDERPPRQRAPGFAKSFPNISSVFERNGKRMGWRDWMVSTNIWLSMNLLNTYIYI
jgi:hypothetical protein